MSNNKIELISKGNLSLGSHDTEKIEFQEHNIEVKKDLSIVGESSPHSWFPLRLINTFNKQTTAENFEENKIVGIAFEGDTVPRYTLDGPRIGKVGTIEMKYYRVLPTGGERNDSSTALTISTYGQQALTENLEISNNGLQVHNSIAINSEFDTNYKLLCNGKAKITDSLDMSNQRIQNIANPVDEADAVNKRALDLVNDTVQTNRTRLNTIEPKISTLEANTTSLFTDVMNTKSKAENNEAKIYDVEGLATGLEARVSNIEGNLYDNTYNITAIENRLTGIENDISALQSGGSGTTGIVVGPQYNIVGVQYEILPFIDTPVPILSNIPQNATILDTFRITGGITSINWDGTNWKITDATNRMSGAWVVYTTSDMANAKKVYLVDEQLTYSTTNILMVKTDLFNDKIVLWNDTQFENIESNFVGYDSIYKYPLIDQSVWSATQIKFVAVQYTQSNMYAAPKNVLHTVLVEPYFN